MSPKTQLIWTSIVSFVIACLGVTASVLIGVVGATPAHGSYGVAAGEACLNYEEWALNRIEDGMSDDEIATLTLRAIEATGGDLSPFGVNEPRDEAFLYEPCLIEKFDDALLFIKELRAASLSD
ncbi:hypothetical protein ACI78V_09175 [Geodermatophilus sp. SYSU D00742]